MTLFLDLGCKMGWVVVPDDKEDGRLCVKKFLYHGAHDLNKGKKKNGFCNGYKYKMFMEFLEDRLKRFEINKIYYEEILHNGGFHSAAAMSGMKAVLELFSEVKRISITGIHNGKIKKYLTGKGNATKIEVRDAVVNKLGLMASEIEDDNDSDALALMIYAMDNFDYG